MNIPSKSPSNDADNAIQRDFNKNILDNIRSSSYLRVNFQKKALRNGSNVLYKQDYHHLMSVIQINNSPVIVTGNKTRSPLDDMDKLNVKLLAAPDNTDDAELQSLQELLKLTTSTFTKENYLSFKLSNNYQKFYNAVEDYKIGINSLTLNQEQLGLDDPPDPNFNADNNNLRTAEHIDAAFNIDDNDIGLIFSFTSSKKSEFK